MLTDPITDYLNRIRNALLADHEDVEIPASRLKREMTRILKEQGYVSDFTVEPGRVGEVIKIRLRYTESRDPVISGMDRVSGWYKRTTQYWLFAIGLFIAVSMNVNTLTIADYLYRMPKVREAVVKKADAYLKAASSNPGTAKTSEPVINSSVTWLSEIGAGRGATCANCR